MRLLLTLYQMYPHFEQYQNVTFVTLLFMVLLISVPYPVKIPLYFPLKKENVMYKECMTKPARERQRQLEQGLLSVMLHHNYEDISVSDLCDSLGIPRKSFYRYFSSKDGALYALIDHTLLDFVDELFPNGPVMNMQTGEALFRYWLSKKDLLRALDRNNLSGLLVQRTIELTISDNRFHPSFLPQSLKPMQDYALLFLVTGIMSLLVQWEKDNFKATPKEMTIMTAHILNQAAFKK